MRSLALSSAAIRLATCVARLRECPLVKPLSSSLLSSSVIGNIVFSFMAERKNPPIGNFIECEGQRLHFLERGDRAAPCVVLFHGNGSMI